MQEEVLVSRDSSYLKSYIVNAGAGTGKTTRLIEEVFNKIEQKLNSDIKKEPRLIVCTFTNKATQELKERLIEKAIDRDDAKYIKYINSSSLHISTIHGILMLFLQTYGNKYDLDFDLDLISEHEENRLAQKALSHFIYKEEHIDILKNISYSDVVKILKLYNKKKIMFPETKFMKASSVEESENKEDFVTLFSKMQKLADEFQEHFLNEKKKLNILTYDDLELFSLDLIRKDPKVVKSFSSEWDYWFIDEYQDTSLVQEMIFKEFTNFQNVFCVGDPQQSIYAFRGAEPYVFERRLEDNKMKKEVLNTNYRSHFSLISFFNDFFKQKENILELKSKKNEKFSDSCVYTYKYSLEETDSCFKSIVYHIDQLSKKGVSYKDICILSRKNEHLSNLYLYLKQKNIPVYMKSKESFRNNRTVLDALFAIRVLINPHDKENLLALLRTPYFFVSDKNLSEFCKKHDDFVKNSEFQNTSFWNFIKDQNLFPIQKLKKCLDLKSKEGLVNSFEKIIFERGFMDIVNYQDSSKISESYLWKFLSLVRKTEKTNDDSILDLFYKITQEELDEGQSASADSPLDTESVHIMTIHQSKGLQFKNVLLFDLTQKSNNSADIVQFDSSTKDIVISVRSEGKIFDKRIKCKMHEELDNEKKTQASEESQRLLYVAMTRAEETLAFFLPQFKPKQNPFKGSLFYGFFDFLDKSQTNSNYILQKKESIGEIDALKNSVSKIEKLDPIEETVKIQSLPYKSSRDYTDEEELKSEEKPFVLNYFKNVFFKSYLGNQMHYILELLTKHSFSVVEDKVRNMNIKENEALLKALKYISELEEPDLKSFFKGGYAEWPFQLKTKKAILKGRIDLWNQKGDEIWIFDYKSSSPDPKKDVFKQTSFYAYVLDQIYKPDQIIMNAVYPIAQKIKKRSYSKEDRQKMILWLESIT